MDVLALTDLPDSLRDAEMIEVMVAGANARAARVAPCLSALASQSQLDEARLILTGAIKRWVEAGAGSFTQQTAGPFSQSTDTRQRSGFNFWPSEIESLQGICSGGRSRQRAFSIEMGGA